MQFQEVQEAQSLKEAGPKEEHTKAHHHYISQDETEGENFRSSKRKGDSYLQKSSHKTFSWFLQRYLTGRRGWKEVFKVLKGKDLHPTLLYPAKLSFRIEGQIKCFSEKVKLKEFIITQALIIWNVKGTYLRKRRSKIGTVKMTANSQLLMTTPKTKTRAN